MPKYPKQWLNFQANRAAVAFAEVNRDKPPLNLVEWSEKYLSNADGSKFRLRPYQVQPALDLFDERLQYVAIRWFSGAGKTYLFAQALCFGAHQLGLQMSTMMPAAEQAKEWLRDEFDPVCAATPVMARMGYKKRGDQAMSKRWASGAALRALGSNSSGELRRLQVDLMMADEVDAYKQDAGDEGDKLAQFWKRGRGRQRQFHWAASYPSLKGHSRIDRLYDASDGGNWTVDCIHCGADWVMHSKHIVLPGGDPLKAELQCPTCGRGCSDQQRREMSAAGRYVDRKGNLMTSDLPEGHERRRGYFVGCLAHIGDHSAAYPSYLVEVASEMERIRLTDNPEKARRVFTNTMDAESYQPPFDEKVSEEELFRRREDYDPDKELPEGVLMLTIGGDVQGDRLEFEVVGHGLNGETWGCGYHVIRGHTDKPSTWEKVREFVQTEWKHPLYGKMRSSRTFIDSRYRNADVLKFTGRHARLHVYACNGATAKHAPAVALPKTNGKFRCKVFTVGTNELKAIVYQALEREPGEVSYMHFPACGKYDQIYFGQLTAEESEWKDGIRIFTNPDQKRNEALDVRVYALGARLSLNPNFEKLKENLEAKAKPEPKKVKSAPVRPPGMRKKWL